MVSKANTGGWVAAALSIRECSHLIPTTKGGERCFCGRLAEEHLLIPPATAEVRSGPQPSWNPAKHTKAIPTDAYGSIDFQGGAHPHKAQYCRLAHDSRPDMVLSLLTQEWGLEPPKLLITVHGGKKNFELQPRLKKELGRGLLKAAKTTGAWVLTGGLSIGVTRHVGDALVTERSPRLRSGRVVSIGIAPWGIVDNRQTLVQQNKDVPYHSLANPASKFSPLNQLHSHFLLVDNGTVEKYGAELALRRKLERFISTQQLNASQNRQEPYYTHCSTPLVCLVIEGGTNTIRAVLEYVTSSPPVPVVIFDGTGRAADLLAFAHRYMGEDGDTSVINEMYEELIQMIQRTFQVDSEQADQLLNELVRCVKKRNLVTVFRCSDENSIEENPVELDHTILNALFKSQHLSPTEQLSLALTWNREDIARSEIFRYGVEWETGNLDQAMMDALIINRVAFVTLLLEHGVNMQAFLTMERLEALYNCRQGPANTLGYLVRDVVPGMAKDHTCSLIEVGMVINQLIGRGYQSSYTRRNFRHHYNSRVSSSSTSRTIKNKSITRTMFSSFKESSNNSPQEHEHGQMFSKPFSELLIWAVLTKRQDMALIMWQHGEEAMAKALMATALYNAMAYEAEDDDLDVEIFEELTKYSEVFQEHACQLLDHCYHQDDDITQQLLTASLENWSRQTCLSLAVLANNRRFLAHPLSQIILGDLWMGGLRMRKNPGFKIVLGLLLPPTIAQLEFKTKEELELMPQTEEELLVQDERDTDVDNSSHTFDNHSNSGSIDGRSYRAVSQDSVPIVTQEEEEGNGRTPLFLGGPIKRMRPLKMKKKLYEFYGAPITKFYSHFIAYMVFLGLYTYMCLVKTPPVPSVPEVLVTAYIATYGLEKLRQLCALEPSRFSQKLGVWMADSNWHLLDVTAICLFLSAAGLRWDPSSRASARVMYCTVINYFYIRILKFLAVSKYFGPVVAMLYRMMKNMLYFIVLLLVVLVGFGVHQQSIKFPNEEWHWRLLRHVFYQPYFMLYGEVYAPDIDPDCNEECTEFGKCGEQANGDPMVPCHPGRWVTPIAMTLYLLAANILILNLLIAVFNNIYQEVKAISNEVWNFQRYSVVMEYEEKPTLPPPLIIFSHFWRLVRFLYRRLYSSRRGFQSGLKLFLSKDDMDRLYDFEEECMEGYMKRNKEGDSEMRELADQAVLRELSQRVEQLSSGVQRLERQSDCQNLTKLEDLCDQTAASLAVIHRFMATHMEDGRIEEEATRTRTVSETSGHDFDREDRFRMALRSAPLDRTGRAKSPFSFETKKMPKSPSNSRLNLRRAGTGRVKHNSGGEVKDSLNFRLEKRKRRVTEASEKSGLSNKSIDPEDDKTDLDDEVVPILEEQEREEQKDDEGDNEGKTKRKHQGDREVLDEFKQEGRARFLEARTSSERGSLVKQASHVEDSHSSYEGLGPSSAIATHRRDFNRRDYTSITDELEVLLPGGAQGRDENEPTPPVAIRIEEHMLKDAEDDDYNAFENLIERRMRRDSCDMHSSMEDMVNKSIRNSSSSSSEDEAPGAEGGLNQRVQLQRGQSRIRTRKAEDRDERVRIKKVIKEEEKEDKTRHSSC